MTFEVSSFEDLHRTLSAEGKVVAVPKYGTMKAYGDVGKK